MATSLPSFDQPAAYRVTVGTTAVSLSLPATPTTIHVTNLTSGAIVYVETSGNTATVPVAGGAPGAMPVLGGPGSIPVRIEKGNSTSISLIGNQAGINVVVTPIFGSLVMQPTRVPLYAALDLTFLDMAASSYLDPRIDFTRASAGTYFGSDGLLKSAGYNLLTYSEQFDNAAWVKSRTTISSNVVTAPDGTLTADKLVEDTATNSHNAAQNLTVASGVVFTYTVYIKAAERTYVGIYAGFPGQGVIFNLSTGTFSSNLVAAPTSYSIVSVGVGWYRCSITYTSAGTSTAPSIYICSDGTTFSYTGDGTSGIYVWGAQLETGSVATSYARTTSTASGGARFDYDPATPNGTMGVELAPALQAASWGSASGFSFDGTGKLILSSPVQYGNIPSVAFAVTVGKTYRIAFTVSSYTSGTVVVGFTGQQGSFNAGASSVGTFSATLVATNLGITIQAITAGAALTISNVSIQEVTFTPKGLLIEEARTNLILQSRDMTQASWNFIASATAAHNQIGLDGTYSANKVADASAFVGSKQIIGISSIAVSASTTYAFSIAVKAAEYGYAEIQLVDAVTPANFNRYPVINLSSGAVAAANGTTLGTDLFVIPLAGGWWRVVIIAPLGAATTSVQVAVGGRPTGTNNTYNGVVGSGVLFDCAQLEAGAFATSYIPTVASTVTRAADVAQMTGTNFSSWFNAGAGTFVLGWDRLLQGNPPVNEVLLAFSGTVGLAYVNNAAVFNGHDGTNYATAAGSASTKGPHKAAWAYGGSAMAADLNGGAVGAGTYNNSFGAVTGTFLGSSSGATPVNGHFQRISYYPARLPNATLQSLTS